MRAFCFDWSCAVKMLGRLAIYGDSMPGRLGRSADMVTIAFMVVDASVRVVFTVGTNLIAIAIALGADIGLGIDRLVGSVIGNRLRRKNKKATAWQWPFREQRRSALVM